MSLRISLLLSLFLLGCEASVTDDDDVADDDDAVDGDDVCGDPSGGTGGTPGESWMSTPDFTVNEATSQYASFLIVPNGAVPETGLPVLVLMARRMPDDRGTVEQVVAEFLEFRDFATAEGYLVAMVVPGPAGGSNNWTTSQTDEDFFGATLDEVGSQYDIDRDRVHVWGSSAGATAAALIGHTHADRLASILAHAGRSPWTGDAPEPWPGEIPALFVHSPDDDVVSRAAVDEIVAIWGGANQRTETWFDYPHGHQWVPSTANGPMVEFFESTCNE
jgi:pimeloyl-ACP methyl ester carboxylesterase